MPEPQLSWPCVEGDEQTMEYRDTARCREGYARSPSLTEPVISVEHSGGSSLTCAVFLRGAPLDPASGELRGEPSDVADKAGGPVAFAVGPDGSLHYLALNYGAVYRIDYAG